jgi:hypothetical protein
MFEDRFQAPKAASGKHGGLLAFCFRERRIERRIRDCRGRSSYGTASHHRSDNQKNDSTQEQSSIHDL